MDKMTEARLRLIKARAEALGWAVEHESIFVWCLRPPPPDTSGAIPRCLRISDDSTLSKWSFEAAERLLACYEPGPVVRIGDVDCRNCDLNVDGGACGLAEVCPGAGTYKLIPIDYNYWERRVVHFSIIQHLAHRRLWRWVTGLWRRGR